MAGRERTSDDGGARADGGSGRDGGSDPDVEIALIAAVAENGVIGADGGMPWNHPADLEQFRETTMGHPVVLGRRTFESIVARLDGPLPGRTSVVLSSGFAADHGDVVVVGGVDEALEVAAEDATERGVSRVFVAGGATVYEQFLPRADRMVLTEVPGRPDGDTYFPEWDRSAWVETKRAQAGELAFVTHERR